MNDRERMLKAVYKTHKALLKFVDENYPEEENEMTPAYAIENLEIIKKELELDINRYKNSIGLGGRVTIADDKLIEKYRTIKYVIEVLKELEE